jgi:hypothetical protein
VAQRHTYRPILIFWAPLALMWLIMGIEQPTIGAVVSRLPNATRSLAAFEVAFGLATLIHSPIIQMLSVATALTVDKLSFRRLLVLLGWIVGVLSAVHAIVAIPAVFSWIAGSLLGVPELLIPHARTTFTILLPITAAVGLRRMLQGALIRVGNTRVVSLIMVARLIITTLFLGGVLALDRWTSIALPSGNAVASLAFVLGVSAGAVASVVAAARILPRELAEQTGDAPTPGRMLSVYIPLALTSVIIMIGRPLITFAISRSPEPVSSLAAWPIVQGYLFVFTALAHSYQEVVVARASSHPGQTAPVAQLGYIIGLVLAGTMAILAITPASALWFRSVIGVPGELMPLVVGASAIVVLSPLLIAAIGVYSGILVAEHRTVWITAGTIVSIAAQIVLGIALPRTGLLNGAQVGSIILVISATLQVVVQRLGVGFEPARPRRQ